MDIIDAIGKAFNDLWNMLMSTQTGFGFTWGQWFIGLTILEIVAEFFGYGIYGLSKSMGGDKE